MEVVFHKRFTKAYQKLPSSIQHKADERILLFLADVEHASLRNHALKGERRGQWSIDITGSYRAVYEWCGVNAVRFLDINTHSELYGKKKGGSAAAPMPRMRGEK